MNDASIWPAWLDAHICDDQRFASAYAAASDRQRSLLKAHIAALWRMFPPTRVQRELRESSWDEGGQGMRLGWPRPWAILCVDGSANSPSLVLAALMPALTAGVPEILVAGIGSGALTDPVLAALELAGQELVVELEPEQARELVQGMEGATQGLVMGLGAEVQSALAGLRQPTWTPNPRTTDDVRRARFSLGVFLEKRGQFSKQLAGDMEYLLPGVEVCWWSPSGRLGPEQAERQAGDFDAFGRNCFDTVLVPDYLSRRALESFPAVLGLGRAGNWIWPDLTRDLFTMRHAAML